MKTQYQLVKQVIVDGETHGKVYTESGKWVFGVDFKYLTRETPMYFKSIEAAHLYATLHDLDYTMIVPLYPGNKIR